jgi:exopolysaccharide production protein ExoY
MKGFALSSSRSFQRADVVSQRPVGGVIKRGFDIGAASLGLIFFSPLLLLIACLIAFSDGGPAFQRHLRIGRGGCIFTCLMFRTTVEEASGLAPSQLRALQDARANGTVAEAFERGQHVTPIGAVLTKLGLVELPQFINILRGDMSIVGPRPVAPGELEIQGSAAEYYLKSRPGLTGPWRLGASDEASHAHRPTFERFYAENWSFLGDLRIIARSVSAASSARSG